MDAIHDKTTAEYIKLNAELATIDAKRQAQVLKSQGELAAVNATAFEKAVESWQKLLQPIANSFDKMIVGMIQGTTTLHQAMQKITQSILTEFISVQAKTLTHWIATELAKTQASAAGASARGAIEETAAATSIATSAMASIKGILNSAWETMANVYKSIAAIPIVGPVLAPAAAMGAFAVVKGFAGSIASAAGGYNIPQGVNPLTQLHQN